MKFFIFDLMESDLQYFTELFCAVPLLSDNHYKRVLEIANTWNENLYSKLRVSTFLHTYTNAIQDCDIAIIPFKYHKNDSRITEYCNIANTFNKKVICFYNDDNSEVFDLPNNLYLFRTSVEKSHLQANERAFAVIVPDHYYNITSLASLPTDKTITFCGHTQAGRLPILEKLKTIYSDTNFVYRQEFWAPELKSRHSARKSFYTNLLSGSFTLCMRGAGNFSYRFYEALSFGRIPILIDTDCVLPFENTIDWNDYIIRVNKENINSIPELIDNCKISPHNNRVFWETFLSPEGYYNKFIQDI